MASYRIGERRVFDYKGMESPGFDIQEWRGCDCPDCPSDGHWKTLKSTDNVRLAWSVVEVHNGRLLRSAEA